MQLGLRNSMFLMVVASAMVLFSCSSDANLTINLDDPTTFPGTYQMKTMTFKTGYPDAGIPPNFTIQGGRDTQVTVNNLTFTVNITVTMVLTDTSYTQTINISVPGVQVPGNPQIVTGTYSINGNQLMVTSDDLEQGTGTATVTVNGNEMTVDSPDATIVFTKTK